MKSFGRMFLVVLVIFLCIFAATACRSNAGNSDSESQEGDTSREETLQPESSVSAQIITSAQTTEVQKTTETDKVLSGTLLGDFEDGYYFQYYGGPLFTYNEAEDVLIAYCYTQGSSHLPYNLTYAAKNDGCIHQFIIPEFDLTVYYYFDTDYGVWRLFDHNPDTPPIEGGNSEISEWNSNEFRVYYDTEDILAHADQLYRFNYSFCTPKYREYDEVLFFEADMVNASNYEDGFIKEISVDMNSDGTEEQIKVAPVSLASSGGELNSYAISINGDKKIDVEWCNEMIGIYVTDISKEDSYKEVICEFGYADGYTQNYIIRYDGKEVKQEVFDCVYDIPGNGSILVGKGQFLQTVVAKKEYSVDSSYNFTQKQHLFDTDINVTSIIPLQVKYDTGGKYVDGILDKGSKIEIYMVDYVSKAYFVTDTGKKGLLTLDGLTLEPDGKGTWECFTGLLFGG